MLDVAERKLSAFSIMVKTLRTEGVGRSEVAISRWCEGSCWPVNIAIVVPPAPQVSRRRVDSAKSNGTSLSKKRTGSGLKTWASAVLIISFLCASLRECIGQTVSGQPARIVTEYALTSTHDYAAHDPSAWRLLGSNNGGKSWAVLDARTNEVFSGRNLRRVFSVNNRTAYNTYRLEVDNSDSLKWDIARSVQLAELELMGPLIGVDNETNLQPVITASDPNPMGPPENAFDGDVSTCWVDLGLSHSGKCWIQYQYALNSELLVTNVSQMRLLAYLAAMRDPFWEEGPKILSNLTACAGEPMRTVTGYAMTSANDTPERDPRNWRLLGSNDGGKTWRTLDIRTNEIFSSRFKRREFALNPPARYQTYRLEIDSIAVPGNPVQIAEIEPLYSRSEADSPFSLVVSAEGDNPPFETADKAFDGKSSTKWLDFFSGDPARPSWIQWQYVPPVEDLPVVNLRDLSLRSETVHHSPPPMKLQLTGVVVSLESNLLGFLDESGFQLLRLGSPVTNVRPGEQIQLSGRLQFMRQLPVVTHPKAASAGALTAVQEVRANQAMGGLHFLLGAGQGKVTAVSDDGYYLTVELSPDDGEGRLTAKIFNWQHASAASLMGKRLRVAGVVESVLTDNGSRIAGNIWASDFNAVSTYEPIETPLAASLQPATSIYRALPVAGIREVNQLIEAQDTNTHPATIRGVITYIDLNLGAFYVQDGMDNIMLYDQQGAGISSILHEEGSYIELKGEVSDGIFYPTAFATVVGRGQMPEPLRHSWDYLMTGRDDGNWVELEGVISAIEGNRLSLVVTGGRLIVWINDIDKNFQDHLLGSVVRIDGVCAPVINSRNQRLGQRLLVPSSDYIQIEKAAPENPFDMPTTAIGDVMKARNWNSRRPIGLTKTAGIVTYSSPGLLFVQDKQDGIRVVPRKDVDVKPGDRVEVVGLAQADGLSPELEQALVRKVGQASLPAATPIDLAGIYSDSANVNQDATRGEIEATFLGQSVSDSGQILELQSDTLKKPSYALLPVNSDAMPIIPVGSRIRLEGVFKAATDTVPDSGQVVSSFAMYLNSPADIHILSQPSWWTAQRMFWLSGGLCAVLFLSLAWVVTLRRQVLRRTRELHEEIDGHKHTEAQLQGEIAERKQSEKIQETMFRISQAMHTTGSLDDLYREIHQVLRQLMPAKNFFIALHNPAGDGVSFPYFVDQRDGNFNPPRQCGKGLTEYVLRAGKALHATREVYDRLIANGEVIPVGTPHVDWLGVPLKIDERTVGVMAVQSYTERVHFSQRDMDILQFVSNQVAIVTERKQAEEKIREQAALLDDATDAIWVLNLNGRISYWNKGAERIYGWSAAEAVGNRPEDLLFRGTQTPQFREYLKAVKERGEWTGELEEFTKDGKTVIIQGRSNVIRDEQDNLKSVLMINTNITEKKKIETQFLRSQRMESIGTLAGGIAHDLNNVLTPLLFAVEMLKEKINDAEGHKLLGALKSNVERGAKLVKQVLTFSRGVQGERVPVQPAHLVREIKHIIQETFPKSVEFEYDAPADLWPVIGDSTQLHQVLMNLCVNARDAMHNGGKLSIHIKNVTLDETYADMNSGAKPGPFVVIEVADTGVGIPKEIQDRIFEPFFTTKGPGQGTGLGLSTSLGIVKSHGGFISCYSEPGKRGSTFKVYLPANASTAAVEDTRVEQTRLPRGHEELVLLVDDEEAIREVAQKTLERFGYRVRLAANGAEAVSMYSSRQDEIAVVITDMAMPVMDGPAVIGALQSINPKVKIICSSGYEFNPGTKTNGAGVRPFIPKPYRAETMLNTLHRVLHGTVAPESAIKSVS